MVEQHKFENFLQRLRGINGTLEQVLESDDDAVLSSTTIIERSEMNSLQKMRATIRTLEDAVTKAHQKKKSCDTKLAQKEEELKRLQPVLADGVVAAFEMSSTRQMYEPSLTLVQTGRTGRLWKPEKIGAITAAFEKEAARMAHHGYMEAVTDLERARTELRTFERGLIELRDKMECLGDL